MGRIRTKLVKRTGKRLMKENKDLFNRNFEDNKKTVVTLADINSKKLRNVIAGYITKLVREKNE